MDGGSVSDDWKDEAGDDTSSPAFLCPKFSGTRFRIFLKREVGITADLPFFMDVI